MDPQEWLKLINDHGGIVGHVPVYTKAEEDGVVDKNPRPPMSLVFRDGSTMEAIFEDDGSVSVTKPLKAGPKSGESGPKTTVSGASSGDQYIIQTDPQTGEITQKPNPNYVPPTAKPGSGPRTTAPGSPTDQFLAQTDPTTGAITWVPNKNYVPPTSSQTRAISTPSSDQYIVTMNPDGTTSKQPNPNWVDPSVQTRLKAYQDDLQNQIDAGKLNNSQAIAMFDAQVSMLTAGQNAGQDAVKYAQAATVNQVGPGFGQHFADALSGRGVNFQGADFMYQTPDYAAIARQATAEAIKHLSPYAASIAGTMAPPGGYAPSGGGGYVPGGGGGASGGSAPTAAGVPLAPGVTRDAQGNPGFTAPDGRFIQAQTTPAPPQPGFGAYRPGG